MHAAFALPKIQPPRLRPGLLCLLPALCLAQGNPLLEAMGTNGDGGVRDDVAGGVHGDEVVGGQDAHALSVADARVARVTRRAPAHAASRACRQKNPLSTPGAGT